MPITRPSVGVPGSNDEMRAQPVIVVNTSGEFSSGKSSYSLLNGVSALGAGTQTAAVGGGDYIWRAEAVAWNGATATLQYLGLDGTTWSNTRNAANSADVTLTANGNVAVGIGEGSILRVNVTGVAPTTMRSNLAGL